MKLTLLLLLLSLSVQAQNLIGLKKLDIIERFERDNTGAASTPHFDVANDGTPYMFFENGDVCNYYYYFNEDAVCEMYVVIYYGYSQINSVVEILNKNFTIYQDDTWMDYNEKVDFLWKLKRKEGLFTVVCTIYKIH